MNRLTGNARKQANTLQITINGIKLSIKCYRVNKQKNARHAGKWRGTQENGKNACKHKKARKQTTKLHKCMLPNKKYKNGCNQES